MGPYDNVRFLRSKYVTPEAVLDSVQKRVKEKRVRQIVVVTVDQGGNVAPEIWISGDLRGLCIAAATLTEYSHRYVRSEITED